MTKRAQVFQSRGWKRFRRSRLSIIGLSIITVAAIIALVGPLFLSPDALRMDPARDLAPPMQFAILGNAENGVDLLSALIIGTRLSLFVAILATSISVSIGLIYGAAAGFAGGKIDAMCMRVVDVLLAFPGILLAIYIAAVLPPSTINVVLALCATGWVGYARLARGQVLEIRERDYIEAARALGTPRRRILRQHIIPNILGPVIVQASFGLSTAILAEAALSFLGLGVPPGTPSWGALLDEGVDNLLIAPHLSILPGLCIFVTVLGFNFLGDGLRDVFDVRSQQ